MAWRIDSISSGERSAGGLRAASATMFFPCFRHFQLPDTVTLLVHECPSCGSGAFEAAQEARLSVDAGVGEFAQEDGDAKPDRMERDGQGHVLRDQNVDQVRDEGPHGRVIDTVDRGRFCGFHGWSVTLLACRSA